MLASKADYRRFFGERRGGDPARADSTGIRMGLSPHLIQFFA